MQTHTHTHTHRYKKYISVMYATKNETIPDTSWIIFLKKIILNLVIKYNRIKRNMG